MDQPSPVIPYLPPSSMAAYEPAAILSDLVDARSAVATLRELPFQRAWVEDLQRMELKREIAGTSRIEGAEFTERELETAMRESPEQLHTRSQRQAHAAVGTYRWIAQLPRDRPIDRELICEIHRRLVTGADDDHCEPGRLRGPDQNVTFGTPRHRGVEGGDACSRAMDQLAHSIATEFRELDPLIQALAAHYHLAAMHPFLDGNGRTARALEALMLQRAGLRDSCFIAMSNYYHDEKPGYLAALAAVRAVGFDLTAFLKFGLRGIAIQARRMADAIKHEIAKGIYRNVMFDLFQRLRNPRRRVIAERQIGLLKILLDREQLGAEALFEMALPTYSALKEPWKAVTRDLGELLELGAIAIVERAGGGFDVRIRLAWATEVTESEFFKKVAELPHAKSRVPF